MNNYARQVASAPLARASHDPFAPIARPRRPRLRAGHGTRLLRALLALAGPHAELVSHREQPWASITFAGARHGVVLRFAGWDGADDAEQLIADLPAHEFAIAGAIVADATVTRVDESLVPTPLIEIELELLLLDDE